MAKTYKMTLYVCDLEGNLTLQEIEDRIDNIALNGCAIGCVCHFADEQEGKDVKWDEDCELNYINCPTSAWEKYFEKG